MAAGEFRDLAQLTHFDEFTAPMSFAKSAAPGDRGPRSSENLQLCWRGSLSLGFWWHLLRFFLPLLTDDVPYRCGGFCW